MNFNKPAHPAAAPAEAAEGGVLLGVEGIHHDLLRALDLRPAEGTPAATALGVLRQQNVPTIVHICCIIYAPTCQAVRQCVQSRWPQGSIRMSLLFSAQILHSWNVEPISQYSSYCSWVTCTATTVKYFSSVYNYFSPAHKYFYLDMILGRGLDSPREVGVDAATVGVKVTGTEDTLTCDHHWCLSLCQITVDTYNPSLDPSSRA